MSSIRLDLLDKSRREVLSKLTFIKGEGYLAGGTALSLQIAHRHSYDFDVFLSRPVESADRRRLKEALGFSQVLLDTREQLNFISGAGVRVSLLYYPYSTLFPLVAYPSLNLLSPKDIALDKALTIGRRAAWRDYVDAYFLLRGPVGLKEIVQQAPQKFGTEFNPKLFLEQLVYFEDLETPPINFVGESLPEAEIKNFLVGTVRDFKQRSIVA